MKAIKFTSLLVCALALTFAATGCRKKPVGITDIPGQRTGGVSDPGPGTGLGNTTGVDSGEGVALPGGFGNIEGDYNMDRDMFAANMVHFDYDSAAIRSSEQVDVQAVAEYMKSAAGKALLVEGHCDERGTDEYNRALGERRALSVREALIALGADGNRITTRSHGRDRKIALGNDEASHAQNRRGEFVVLTPK
jgi:outer membrane protein OmpA-like peptidoglycan-associated protein